MVLIAHKKKILSLNVLIFLLMPNLKYIYKRIQLRNKHYLKAPLNIKVLLYKNLVSRLTYIKNKNRALQKNPFHH